MSTKRRREFARIGDLNTLVVKKHPSSFVGSLEALGVVPPSDLPQRFIDSLNPDSKHVVPSLCGTAGIPVVSNKHSMSYTMGIIEDQGVYKGAQFYIPPGDDSNAELSRWTIINPSPLTVGNNQTSPIDSVTRTGVGRVQNVGGTDILTAANRNCGRVTGQTVRIEYTGPPTTCQGSIEVFRRVRCIVPAENSDNSYDSLSSGFLTGPAGPGTQVGATLLPGGPRTRPDLSLSMPLAELMQRGYLEFHWTPYEENDFRFLKKSQLEPATTALGDWDRGTNNPIAYDGTKTCPWLCVFFTGCATSDQRVKFTITTSAELSSDSAYGIATTVHSMQKAYAGLPNGLEAHRNITGYMTLAANHIQSLAPHQYRSMIANDVHEIIRQHTYEN